MRSHQRIYVCHTFYHAYIACLKELDRPAEERGEATLLLSSMSNDFGTLQERAAESGLFELVLPFDEKEESFFKELAPGQRKSYSKHAAEDPLYQKIRKAAGALHPGGFQGLSGDLCIL